MSRRLGLIVGINNYQDTMFRPLQYAENDARALAQWLVNVKGGQWPPADVQLVQGTHATKELIESLITQMCLTMAEPDDLACIYFAGHAFVDERSGDGYLALANTHYQDTTTALHLPSLMNQIMARSNASHILLIFDCYQTGPAWQMRRSSPYDYQPLAGPALLQTLQQQSNRLLLCSCRGNELAAEAGERGLGLFMHSIILGFCGPALDAQTGQASLQSLYTYLFSMLGEQQRPQIFGQERTPMILIGDTSSPVTPPQTPPLASSPLSGIFRASGSTGGSGSGLFRKPTTQAATAVLPPTPFTPPTAAEATPADTQQEQQRQFLLNQAQQFVQAQNYAGAQAVIEQILQVLPQDTSTLILKAQTLGTLGRFQEALTVVDLLTQLDIQNPLIWSMRAVLLTNMGQYPDALTAIDRALALDPTNPETQAIKNNIQANLQATQYPGQAQQSQPEQKLDPPKRNRILSFLIGVVLQFTGMGMGIVGLLLPVLLPGLPATLGLLLAGLGLSLLCVNPTRGAYRYGWAHLLPVLLTSALAAGIIVLGGLLNLVISTHTPTNLTLINLLKTHPSFIVPMLVLGVWLAVAAVVPLILAFGGLITGIIARRRK